MELFGLYGFTHGWGRILTVMSPAGAAAVIAHIDPGSGCRQEGGGNGLPRYFERHAGALEALVSAYGIRVLEKGAWDAKKAELEGDGRR
jgi:hypothetical protein